VGLASASIARKLSVIRGTYEQWGMELYGSRVSQGVQAAIGGNFGTHLIRVPKLS
jgi:hypothetical protein